jgi:hypothetical protein
VLERAAPVTDENPGEMAFVVDERGAFLPRELGALHLPDLCGEHEWVLAPYAIDDATDELYAKRIEPSSCMLLVARSVRGIFWGLHDWAHFHNHGPFERIAETELQCDLAALHWMRLNQGAWEASVLDLARLEREVFAHARSRFSGSLPDSIAQVLARSRRID